MNLSLQRRIAGEQAQLFEEFVRDNPSGEAAICLNYLRRAASTSARRMPCSSIPLAGLQITALPGRLSRANSPDK